MKQIICGVCKGFGKRGNVPCPLCNVALFERYTRGEGIGDAGHEDMLGSVFGGKNPFTK